MTLLEARVEDFSGFTVTSSEVDFSFTLTLNNTQYQYFREYILDGQGEIFEYTDLEEGVNYCSHTRITSGTYSVMIFAFNVIPQYGDLPDNAITLFSDTFTNSR